MATLMEGEQGATRAAEEHVGLEAKKERHPDKVTGSDYSKTDNVRLSQDATPAGEKSGNKGGEGGAKGLDSMSHPDRPEARQETQKANQKEAEVPPMKKLREDQ